MPEWHTGRQDGHHPSAKIRPRVLYCFGKREMAEKQKLEDCLNEVCPWSGKPVSADSLMLYGGQTIGFCNPGCRDKFLKASSMFDALIGRNN